MGPRRPSASGVQPPLVPVYSASVRDRPFLCGQKEVLLHVLHYIQYLQRNIDVAKALLAFHTATGEGEVEGK